MSDSTSSSSRIEEAGIPPAMPKVLTRNVIPTLTYGLDASDVLECYALVRSAPLHGIANSTIHIQKMAIGFRYRPAGAAAIAAQHLEKPPVEMTLEYGPQRFGPLLHHEAMPYIQVSEQESSFISWENVGRVFYTTKIVTETYLSSYYMASMTGAVLNKILLEAVEYSDKRRRYQPFALFSAENGREVRSSSSVDFSQYIWKQLANLGVEIHPILPPPIYEARLWVSSWEKVVPQPAIANEAASFYQKLYQCLEAIATNDYTAYRPSAQPTISPQPSGMPTTIDGENSTSMLLPDETNHKANANKSSSATEAPTLGTTEHANPDDDDQADDDSGRRKNRARRLDGGTDDFATQEDDSHTDDLVKDDDGAAGGQVAAAGSKNLANNNKTRDTTQPTIPGATANPSPSPPPTTHTPTKSAPGNAAAPSGQDGVEKAQQAAADAQQAADEAKNAAQTEGENKAANAAQAAATAAQAAADATSNAAAQAAMDGLLSGDGSTMTSIATSCLTNPQYDIASVDANGTVTIRAFLYRDGSNYYKLNLTSPYFEIAKVNRALPKAVNLSDTGSGGELIDFVLAIVVMSLIFMMGVIILQQMGYKFFNSLFRCQRWFFNPRKFDYEGNTLDDSEDLFNFGQDGIPISMGGRLSRVSPVVAQSPMYAGQDLSDTPELRIPELAQRSKEKRGSRARSPVGRELEMSTMPSSRMRNMRSDNDSHGSLSDDELEVDATVPEGFYRDPDLVDMPYLKSTSKVAVPVGSGHHGTNGGSNHDSRSSDLDAHAENDHGTR